jgi:hypothetical protein
MKWGFTRNRPALSARNGCIEGRSQYRTVKCKGNSRDGVSRGTGGRLSRSSEELWETGWSEGLSLFKFHILNKQVLR